jgi:DNA-directed RNA polymerase specialized sigma subunit
MAEAKSTPTIRLMNNRRLVIKQESLFVYGPGSAFSLREDENALSSYSTPETELRATEALSELKASLHLLSNKERDILSRRDDGESFTEIGAAYGISRQRAFQLAATTRKKLQVILRKRAKYEAC